MVFLCPLLGRVDTKPNNTSPALRILRVNPVQMRQYTSDSNFPFEQ